MYGHMARSLNHGLHTCRSRPINEFTYYDQFLDLRAIGCVG
jgi:hypothetical protein